MLGPTRFGSSLNPGFSQADLLDPYPEVLNTQLLRYIEALTIVSSPRLTEAAGGIQAEGSDCAFLCIPSISPSA